MKILNLCFRNINSLAGQWNIDFTSREFSREGIFLITGPTGSGKTSMLDALSLALYGQTPRITPGPGTGDCISHDQDIAMAEVTVKTNRGTFTSHWEQKRKKQNPDAFSSCSYKFVDKENNIEVTGQKAVSRKVIEYTGLKFEQFTKVVLLAQNKFDVFLSAPNNEKAEILEHLTNSDIYRKLSALAYEKAVKAKSDYARTHDIIESYHLFTPDEKKEKEELKVKLTERYNLLKEECERTREKLGWLKDLETARKQLERVRDAVSQFKAQEAAFIPLAKELEQAKLAKEIKPVYDNWLQLDEEIKRNGELLANRNNAAQDKRRQLELTETEYGRLINIVKELEENLKVERELFDQVKTLDITIGAAQKELNALTETLNKTARETGEAEKELANIQDNIAKLSDVLHRVNDILNRNKPVEELQKNISGIEINIRNYEKALSKGQEIQENIKASRQELARLELENNNYIKDRDHASKDLAETVALVAKKEDHKKALLRGWTLDGLKEALRDKEKAKQIAQIGKSLEEHRKNLKDGEACPLCGALEHPYAVNQIPDFDGLDQECKNLRTLIVSIERVDKEIHTLELKEKDQQQKRSDIEHKLEDAAVKKQNINNRLLELEQQGKEKTREQEDLEATVYNTIEPLQFEQKPQIKELSHILPRLIRDYEKACNEARDISEKKDKQEKEKSSLEARLTEKAKQLRENQARFEELKAAQEAVKRERRQLFGEKNVDNELRKRESGLELAKTGYEKTRRQKEMLENEIRENNGAINTLQDQINELVPKLERAQHEFENQLTLHNLNIDAWKTGLNSIERIEELEHKKEFLNKEKIRLTTQFETGLKSYEDKKKLALTAKPITELEEEFNKAESERNAALNEIGAINNSLQENEKLQQKVNALKEKAVQEEAHWKKWEALNQQIGQKDGGKFSRLAQNITLNCLLDYANFQLAKINPRYTLKRLPGKTPQDSLGIGVIDHYHADELRTVKNLSGGETFLVSLSLALGLSAMAGKNASIQSLFLDEGFGTLDSETLDVALTAIENLRQEGKLIGIISHVEALKGRIGTELKVLPEYPGRSIISGPGCSKAG